MNYIELQDVEKVYSLPTRKVVALPSLSVKLPLESITTIIGPSGCGKTTLLRILAGLTEPSKGTLQLIENTSRKQLPPIKQGMVFQEARLFPWLRVKENMRFAEQGSKKISSEIVMHYLQLLGLEELQDAYPHQLSGGQAQRVAVGRALCSGATILLMDEPASALDFFTRQKFQEDLYTIFIKEKKTIFLVTHDLREAARLGDQILCLTTTGKHQLIANATPRENRLAYQGLHTMEECILQTLNR